MSFVVVSYLWRVPVCGSQILAITRWRVFVVKYLINLIKHFLDEKWPRLVTVNLFDHIMIVRGN
jgi:hypothetical protein